MTFRDADLHIDRVVVEHPSVRSVYLDLQFERPILPPHYVQSNSTLGTALANSTAVTPSSPVGAGNLLVVCWGASATGDTVTITDTNGNTWSPATVREENTNIPYEIQIYWAQNNTSASDTVTASTTGVLAFRRLAVLEYAGSGAAWAFDNSAAANGSGVTMTVGPFVTGAPNEMGVGWMVHNATPVTPGSGWTQRETPGGEMAEDMILNPAGLFTATANGAGSDQWLAVAAAWVNE